MLPEMEFDMDPRTADVLEEAADNLLICGWQRGAFGALGGTQCAAGHLNTATIKVFGGQPGWNVEDRREYQEFMNLYLEARSAACEAAGLDPLRGDGITRWNDLEAADEWEVRDTFLTAAKSIRGSGGL